MANKSRKRVIRRDRRLARMSGWRREPKGSIVGHGTNLPFYVTPKDKPMRASLRRKIARRQYRVRKNLSPYVSGPSPKSPFLTLLEAHGRK